MIKSFVAILMLFVSIGFCCASESDPSKPLPPVRLKWKFDGVFGYFDVQSIQRGFKVYKEVCSVCHSLSKVRYGALQNVGFTEAEVKALASEYSVTDGPNDQGEMFARPATINDYFAPPFKNENAARAANNGAYPVDLSLIIKARPNGANYVYSLLTGFVEAPSDFKVGSGLFYNPYFPGRQIAMTQPLTEGMVAYSDSTAASVDQMAKDVVYFLQWAAEPEMEKRKIMGIKVLLYLAVFTVLFWFAKKRIWRNIK